VTVYHGTQADRAASILSGGFADGRYNFAGSAIPSAGETDGVFVAPSPQRALQHGPVVIAVEIDAPVSFERSEEALIPAADLNRWPRRILAAERFR
jgi:hypothetical protein